MTKGNAYTEREKGKVGDREKRKEKKEEEFEEEEGRAKEVEGRGGGSGEEEDRREKNTVENISSLLNFSNERSDWMCMLK